MESWCSDKDLLLKKDLLRGIYNYGFESPSNIQKKTIPEIQLGKDIIAQAPSGTGKTGAFLIGVLQRLTSNEATQCIIVSPTKELAIQTTKVCTELSKYMNIKNKLVIGGQSVDVDIAYLKETRPHIVIGSSGRIYDMIRRGFLCTKDVSTIVLDEADEMLSRGFVDQTYDIFSELNENVQIVLFSATFPPELDHLTNRIMRDPVKILVESSKLSLDGITQYNINLELDKYKFSTLCDIFQGISMNQTIIYCNNIKRVMFVYDRLVCEGNSVCFIHGEMSDLERNKTLDDFKVGNKRILISTDLTSRGIDIQQVSVVINYDVPFNKHVYLHRIGRSGRWGRKGLSINFVTRRDENKMREIESWYKITIEELPLNFINVLK